MIDFLIAVAFLAFASVLGHLAKILNACVLVSRNNDERLGAHTHHIDKIILTLERSYKATQSLENARKEHANAINAQATAQLQIEERLKRLEQRLNQ